MDLGARVTADVIDTGSPPAVSFLRHGPNVAAQSLLRNPVLRALPAVELGRALHVSTSDARSGIASVTGLVSRVAMHGQAALMEEPRLSIAVGPFMNLDQALSRYASHRGPIVVSPSPMFRADAGAFMEAGDTNVSDQGDPANADQGQPAAGGGDNPLGDLGQGGGAAFGGGGGAQDNPPAPLQQGNGGGGGGPAPTPLVSPGNTGGVVSPPSSVPGWVWVLGAAAAVLIVANVKKNRRAA